MRDRPLLRLSRLLSMDSHPSLPRPSVCGSLEPTTLLMKPVAWFSTCVFPSRGVICAFSQQCSPYSDVFCPTRSMALLTFPLFLPLLPLACYQGERTCLSFSARLLSSRCASRGIYQDESFAHLFPQNGRPVEAPWRLAFITVVQFIEGLPDRQAADAVRGRIDLKYARALELTDPGFDFTVLSHFRKRLVEGGAEQVLLDAMLALFKEQGWLTQRQRQRTDSTHVLAKVRAINRLMCVGEAMRFALNSLAIVAGEWLLAHSDPQWVDRYGHRIEESRLPRSQEEREAVAELIGRDGSNLLTDLYAADAPLFLCEIPAVQILRRIWVQNYVWVEGQIHWRSNEDLPPGKDFINSPYDQEARYGKKRETRWTGYKVHVSET